MKAGEVMAPRALEDGYLLQDPEQEEMAPRT